ncbi:TPA: RNA-guided pseudouridylation complex pseudouridine synthase subunit Cbf5, partial [Candidatus Thalassarchaeaceae archaeon]
ISHGAALARPGVVSLSEGIERGDLVVLESLKGEAVALAETNSAASKIASMQHGEVARPKVVLMQVGVYPQTWSKE